MVETVCTVVVTYNRKDLLRVCLDSVLAQTRPADFIVVVDNASTDGTLAMLAASYPQLFVLKLPVNSGGAGGFHAGMKWAHEQGYDWIWIMDDDVVTYPEALETMLRYGHIGDFIHGRKLESHGLLVWEAMWDVSACRPLSYRTDISFENGKEWTGVSYANFEGALIRRKVMDKVGFPDVRYFIAGDDAIYGYLASLHVQVIYINFLALHKTTYPGRAHNRFYYYFQTRNRFLTYEHFVRAGLPLSRKIFLLQVMAGAFSLLMEVVRLPQERKLRNVRYILEGLSDGMRGRFGKPVWI